jgi:hypothetical protein
MNEKTDLLLISMIGWRVDEREKKMDEIKKLLL